MTDFIKKKILICDDEPLIREAISYAVKKLGHDYYIAKDGEEALQQYKAISPDLVLLDVGMPKMSGFDVCSGIRKLEHDKRAYIIIVTAFGQKSDQDRAIECGADEYMSKPFSPRDLMATIEKIFT